MSLFTKDHKNVSKIKEKYDLNVDLYDASYEYPFNVLKKVGLRFMTNDSKLTRKLWSIFFWTEYLLLIACAYLELKFILDTALGAPIRESMEAFTMVPCFGCIVSATTKSYKMWRYQTVFENLIRELRSMWPRGYVEKEDYLMITRNMRRLKITIIGYYWCNNMLLVLYLCRPYIGVIKKVLGFDVPLTLPFFLALPVDQFQQGLYETLLLSETRLATVAIWCMFCGDIIFCISICHITNYFDLLCLRIKRLFPVDDQLDMDYKIGIRKNIKTDLETEKSFEKELKSINLRHQDLIRLSNVVEEIYSFLLLINFFNSSIIICFCGFCGIIFEKWNELVYKMFLATVLSQTLLLYWHGNRLIDSSKSVADALYSSGWYTCTKSIKKSLIIMICRAQKNEKITTYGFSTISLASFTTILKSSWSYFTLLLHFLKK